MTSGSIVPIDSAKLRAARQRKILTQAQLAEKIGVSAFHVSRYETGRSSPRASVFYKILAVLDLEQDDLADWPVL